MNKPIRQRLQIRSLAGPEAVPWTAQMAALRIAVFREFPYLYEGSEAYERDYLQVYFDCPESVCVLALDGDRLVGVSTGLPMLAADAAFAEPFHRGNLPAEAVFYFGESVLLPAYRGCGIGHAFFDQREAWASALGTFRWTAFCAVDRALEHPSRPSDYRPLDTFWQKRGYHKRPDLHTQFEWKEVGQTQATPQQMTFWLKALSADTPQPECQGRQAG